MLTLRDLLLARDDQLVQEVMRKTVATLNPLMPAIDAVLLIAFGGPERMEDVRPFLDNVLRGRPAPEAARAASV